MFSWMWGLFKTTEHEKRKINQVKKVTMKNPGLLREEERRQAEKAKELTQRLLSDALKKEKSLLVEDPKDFEDQKMVNYYSPLLTIDLVKELIQELEKVTFAKNTNPEQDIIANAYVYTSSEDRTIYLCASFWKMDPESRSQQNTIIHEVSHFLGYGHTVQENSDRVKESPQSMLCPLTAYSVASALTSYMKHPGTYRNGSYSCCGETSRDTVCEKSWMENYLRLRRQINQLRRQLLHRDTAGDETATTCKDTDISGEDTYSSGVEWDSPGEESDTSGEESDTSGIESDTSGEDTYSSGEESDTSGVATDTSFEDTSDEETDTAVKKTDTTILVRRQTDLWKTATNTLIKQTKKLKKQTNMLKKQTNMLKKQTNMLKKQTNMLKKQTNMLKKQTNMLKKQTNMLKKQTNMLKKQTNMLKKQTNMLKKQTNMLKTQAHTVETQVDMVKIKDQMVKTQHDMVKTRVNMVKTRVDMMKTMAKMVADRG